MSELRNKLTTAKEDYHSLKYPGDLMADIAAGLGHAAWQPVQRSRSGWMYGAIAAAAVVGLTVLINTGGDKGVQTETLNTNIAQSVGQAPVVHWGAVNPLRYSNTGESTAMTDGTPREVIFTNKIPQVQQSFVPIDPRTGSPMQPSESRLTDYTIPRR